MRCSSLLTPLLFCILERGSADLPVHCHADAVKGTWEFSLEPPSAERSSCGHVRPDLPGVQPRELPAKAYRQWRVQLATGSEPKPSGGDAQITVGGAASGSWKMIADEGFEVKFQHEGESSSAKLLGLSGSEFAGNEQLSLFAFSRYEVSQGNHTGLSMAAYEKVSVSACDKTMLGWYDVGRKRWGCWIGKRVADANAASAVTVSKKPHLGKPLSFAAAAVRVARINQRQGDWHAKIYHRWLGKTSRDLAAHRGVHWQHTRVESSRRVYSFLAKNENASNTSLQNLTADADDAFYFAGLEAAEKKLPASVDWRESSDPDSENGYLEPVADQGACGSCWAVSGMRMLTARHKIAEKDPKALPWSISFALYCSEYNQGCDGGYGFLAARWSRDVGLLPATCAKYTDSASVCTVDTTCVDQLRSSGAKRWRAEEPRYIGGRQGLATQALLMEELYTRGPAVVGLSGGEIGDDFMFYAGGVYTGEETPPKDKSGGHAVLLCGYGVDDGKKWWLVQNSWGPDWGEDGFVRMAKTAIHFKYAEVSDVVVDEQNGLQVDRVIATLPAGQRKGFSPH